MLSKQIQWFKLSTSLTSDACRIDLQFIDGTTQVLDNLPPHRFAAAVATLQSSTTSYYFYNLANHTAFIGSAADAPGLA